MLSSGVGSVVMVGIVGLSACRVGRGGPSSPTTGSAWTILSMDILVLDSSGVEVLEDGWVSMLDGSIGKGGEMLEFNG